MKRTLIFIYGMICYAISFATLLYAIGFISNLAVPKSIDSARELPLTTALLADLGLLGLFAIQHSVMARPAFKRWWTRIVPETAERSTYTLFASLTLIALFALWQPIGGVVWDVTAPAARTALHAGFALVLTVTHLVFALAACAYILVAIQFEEHDLLAVHPEHADYRRHVPMLVPSLRRHRGGAERAAAEG